jgi:hypothetical protein
MLKVVVFLLAIVVMGLPAAVGLMAVWFLFDLIFRRPKRPTYVYCDMRKYQ